MTDSNLYRFTKEPTKFEFVEGSPLKLSNKLNFFHSKNKFRKELNRLQYIFKDYTGFSLLAPGIRDSYLKNEYIEKFLIVILASNETIVNANEIIQKYSSLNLKEGCYFIESSSDHILLLATNMDGLIEGLDQLEELFHQIFRAYLEKQNFDDFVEVKPFLMQGCT